MKNSLRLCLLIASFVFTQIVQAQTIPGMHKSGDVTLKRGTISQQKCKNHLVNPSANKALTGWKRKGQASVNRQEKYFTIYQASGRIQQDVSIPKGSRYAYVGGYTRNAPQTPRAKAVLSAILIDAKGQAISKIEFSVAEQNLSWEYQHKVIDLNKHKRARTIRFVLRQNKNKNGKNTNNQAYFDNLILSFDCKKQPPLPKRKTFKKSRKQKQNQDKRSIIN